MPAVRDRRILKVIDIKKGVGLEIGPLTAPVVHKGDANIYYLDHMSQEDLKKKYKNEPVDPEQIQPVDFILSKNSLHQSVKGKQFDYIIASHVIEHIPNMVEWLNDVSSALKPNGILSLAIPDKRFTFDLERSVTEPADIVGAYLDKVTRTPSASIYDFASKYAENIDTASAWNDGEYYVTNSPKRRWNKRAAYEMCLENIKPKTYVDSHCHVFTPESFLAILWELTELELLNYELSYFLETQPNELEFYVSLKKASPRTTDKKLLERKIRGVKISKQKERLVEQNETLEEQLDAITHSLSWRLTRPLRLTKRISRIIEASIKNRTSGQ